MDFESVVKRRRMCREYLDRDVPQEKVDRILDLASRYPSAGHTEPQKFIVVRDRRVKEDLARAALHQMFVAKAPLVIVVVSDVRRSDRRYGERGVHFFSIIDGAFNPSPAAKPASRSRSKLLTVRSRPRGTHRQHIP
jgi:nitroreductase